MEAASRELLNQLNRTNKEKRDKRCTAANHFLYCFFSIMVAYVHYGLVVERFA